MPVFKYQISDVNVGSLSLPRVAITGNTAADGDFSLLVHGISGSINNGISGTIEFVPIEVSGYSELDSVNIPSLSVVGFMMADGSIGIHRIGISGIAQQASSFSIPRITADGDVLVGSAINGSISLRKISLSGTGAQGGSVSLRRLSISGNAISGNEIFCSLEIEHKINGDVLVGSSLDGAMKVLPLSFNGDVLVGSAINGSVASRSILVSGYIEESPHLSGDIALKKASVVGNLLIPASVDGDIKPFAINVSGSAGVGEFCNGDIRLFKVNVSGGLEHIVAQFSAGSFIIKNVVISGTAFSTTSLVQSDDEIINYSKQRRLI